MTRWKRTAESWNTGDESSQPIRLVGLEQQEMEIMGTVNPPAGVRRLSHFWTRFAVGGPGAFWSYLTRFGAEWRHMVGCGAVWRFREIWRVSVLGCAGGAHGQSVAHLAHSGTIGGAGACWHCLRILRRYVAPRSWRRWRVRVSMSDELWRVVARALARCFFAASQLLTASQLLAASSFFRSFSQLFSFLPTPPAQTMEFGQRGRSQGCRFTLFLIPAHASIEYCARA